MGKFILSAFADEIDMDLNIQMKVLKEHGINHIEMRGVNGKNIADLTLEEARQVKADLDANGFKLSALGSPIGKIFITEDFEPEKEKFKHTLELAKILDTKYIRMFSFFVAEGEDVDQYEEEVMRRWREYIQLAEGQGIILLHENEKDIFGDTKERCKKLFDTLKCDYMKATFDPANFVQVGEDTKEAFELLKEEVVYMHIKDAGKDGKVVPAGYGIGNLEWLLTQLKEADYTGFLTLEPHLADFAGFDALEGSAEIKLEKGDSTELFGVAVNALKALIVKVEEGREM